MVISSGFSHEKWWFSIANVKLPRGYIPLEWLVGGLEHEFYFPFHIWDNPDNPSHWRTHIFQDGYCTTNQMAFKAHDIFFQGVLPKWEVSRLWIIIVSRSYGYLDDSWLPSDNETGQWPNHHFIDDFSWFSRPWSPSYRRFAIAMFD